METFASKRTGLEKSDIQSVLVSTSSKPNQYMIHTVNIQNLTYVRVSSSLLLIWADKWIFFVKLQTVRASSRFAWNTRIKILICVLSDKQAILRCTSKGVYIYSQEKIQQHRSVYNNSFLSKKGKRETSGGPKQRECLQVLWNNMDIPRNERENNAK